MRTFLSLAAIALLVPSAMAGPRVDNLSILEDAYPRAFYFRQAEALAMRQQTSYEDWEAAFLLLDGIIGKCFDEEAPGRSRRNLDFFTRYKQRHPDKMVLLHYNGNSRDPRFETRDYFAGHWLYHNGCMLTEHVGAEPGDTVLHVEDSGLFSTSVGLFRDRADDIGICQIDEQGRPDWAVAEQVALLAIDPVAKTITVQRGALGTTPRAWPAGKTYVAAHVMEGPWGRTSNMLWTHNYATASPKDAEGKQCADRLADDFTRWFGDQGPLAAFDGVEFDVLFRRPLGGNNLRGVDTNADGQRDDGVNTYEAGVLRFLALLRDRLGDDRLILADGHEEYNQRAVPYLNGIESEGWPHLRDPIIGDWSGGLNRHHYWQAHGHAPRFSYINHKFVDRLDMVDVPNHITRLVMAGAIMTDAAFTFSFMPSGASWREPAVWDELVKGVEQQPRWLGKPLGPPRALALDSPDLLRGQPLPGPWLTGAESGDTRLVLPPFDVPGPDLVVRCVLHADAFPEFGPGVPRLANLTARLAGQLITPDLPKAAKALRGEVEPPLGDNGDLLRHLPAQAIDGETHEAYFAHPPYGSAGTGYLAWEREAHVPEEGPKLEFHTGLREAPSPSDGVVFRVEVTSQGETAEVFRKHHTAFAWESHQVDLFPWAGRTVSLRFITDCGPADNPTSDHAFWGDVYVTAEGRRQRRHPDTPGALMTWVGEKPFESRFYFRDIGPGTVHLALSVEGAGPVRLDALSAHAASDAMAREFEHGLVLANPANQPYTFNLDTLCPGARFRRLRGTQDPATNNGTEVGDTLTLPPRDALFLVRMTE